MATPGKSLMHGEFGRKALVAAGVGALVVVLVVLVAYVARPLLVIFAGVLFAVLLRALTDIVHRYTRLPCVAALSLVVLTLFAVVVGFSWFLAAQVIAQFEQLAAGVAEAWKRVQDYLYQFGWGRVLLQRLWDGELPDGGPDVVARITGGVLAGLSMLVISVFLGLYFAVNPEVYKQGVLRLLPFAQRDRAADIMDKMGTALHGWLLGTLVNMLAVGTMTMAGLWLLGIPMPLALGIVAFFLEFIPYLGPIMAAIPALMIASSVGPTELIYTALLYWGVQSVEGYILAPLVYERSVHLPPALTIGAQIIVGTLFGLLGIVFATPLTACALILVQEAYVEDTLGDPVESEPEKSLSG